MKSFSNQVRSISAASLLALVSIAFTSCQREAQTTVKAPAPTADDAPQAAFQEPATSTATATPAPAGSAQPSAAAADTVHDVQATLKAATTGTGTEQYTAIDDLGEQPEAAELVVPALQKLLTSGDAQVRWRTARALGDFGSLAQAAAPALREMLKQPDAVAQYHAAVALGKIKDRSDETYDVLAVAITSPDARVARASIAALRSLQPDPQRVLAALEKAIESSDQAVTMYALEAIVERGSEAVPLLNEALKRPKSAYLACTAIEHIGPAAAGTVPALVQLVNDTEHSQIEIQALLALAAIGPAAQSAAPDIVPLLEHANDATVPVAAAYALGSIDAQNADDQLKAALTKNNPFLQMVAAWALAKIHPDDEALMKQAVDALTKGLESSDKHIRTAAAKGLEELKAPPELVAPALMKIANDPDPDVVNNAVLALASLGEKVVPRAAERLSSPEVRTLAAKVLRQIGPQAAAAVPQLVAAIPNAPADFRTDVQLALAAMGPAAAPATSVLIESISSDDAGVRESALLALRNIGPDAKAAVPELLKKAQADESFEAMAAAWAVSNIAPRNANAAAKAVPVLTRGLASKNEQIRGESAAALGEWGAAAKPALETLSSVAKSDPSQGVREVAEKSAEKIQSGS